MPSLSSVFISHSHKDHLLAAAFGESLSATFGGIKVHYSSDKEAGGGPQAGHNWLEWIQSKMLECQEALLLLTPYSIQKPWPMWESGAVGGIALATLAAGSKGTATGGKAVIPIRFNLPQESLPGPFVVTQSFDGTNEASLTKLLGDLMVRYNFEGYPRDVIEPVLKARVPPLQKRVREWLNASPVLVTEGTVTEWCARLDQLRERKQSANVAYLHRWIALMYEGRADTAEPDAQAWGAKRTNGPWDVRLHLRLGENYALCNQLKKAIEQYELASELAPLDVYVLYKVAKSHLESGNPEGARNTIDRILRLDPEAVKWNAEVAGLEGRYWKDEGLRRETEGKPGQAKECYSKARDAYQAAMDTDKDAAYYLADNVGQMSFKLHDRAGAEAAYAKAKDALESVQPNNENVWTMATRATTALVLGKEADALQFLTRIREILIPTEDERKRIRGGLELVRSGLGKTAEDYQTWVKALG